MRISSSLYKHFMNILRELDTRPLVNRGYAKVIVLCPLQDLQFGRTACSLMVHCRDYNGSFTLLSDECIMYMRLAHFDMNKVEM